jgi:hypothetical protein
MRFAFGIALLVMTALVAAGCNRAPPHAPAPTAHPPAALLPARVRRLTNVEYERTVSELVAAPEHIADLLPPDVRKEGFTINADQAVPSAWAARLDSLAREVAHRTVTERLEKLVPCAKAPGAACAGELVERLGRRAFRRVLDPSEKALLLGAFAREQKAAGFAAGAEVVLTALLESPSLLYVTELGAGGPPGSTVVLSPYEIASELSYTLRGGPPDDELLSAAGSGELLHPEARERQARRLLAMSNTREHFRRFVLEWLEVDGLDRTAKSESSFPEYESLKSHMLDETNAFVDEVMVYAGGSVRALLDARFASVDPTMARFYGLGTFGPRASLAKTRRTGILQQASFLAAHAHEDGTSPVKRGDFVLRKLLCKRVPRPTEVGIETVFPPPSKAKTTRERFDAHIGNSACSSCHETLDAVGYTFEGFDAIGASRTIDNDKPIDTSAPSLKLAGETVSFADSLELSRWLAESDVVTDCYLRQAFRYFTGQSDPAVESELVALRRDLPKALADNLFEALLAYVRSDLFIEREVRK